MSVVVGASSSSMKASGTSGRESGSSVANDEVKNRRNNQYFINYRQVNQCHRCRRRRHRLLLIEIIVALEKYECDRAEGFM